MTTRGSGVATVLVAVAIVPVGRAVIQGVAIDVHYVLAVPDVGLACTDEGLASLVAVLALLDFLGGLLILGLCLPVGDLLRRGIPAIHLLALGEFGAGRGAVG